MAMERLSAKDLRALIHKAANTPMNFAYCPDPKGDDVLLLNLKKSADVLFKEARKLSGGQKASSGTLELVGGALELSCDNPMPGLSKQLQKFLKSEKINHKVMLKGADEAIADSQAAQEAPAEASPDAALPDDDASPEAAIPPELAERLKSLMATGNAAGPKAAALVKNGAGIVAKQIKAGQADVAARTLGQIEAKLDQLVAETQNTAPEPTQDPAPDAKPDLKRAQQSWAKARKAVSADLKSLAKSISDATQGAEGYEQITSQIGQMAQHFKPLDNRLGTALSEMDAAAPGPKRDKLEKVVRRLVRDHVSQMDSPFFRAVDDNGFANTQIRATVLRSLQQVNAALKA